MNERIIDRARSSSGVPRGFFLTFEGIEGSGKSTQARLLGETLTAHGYRTFLTREPGGTALGESLRELLLRPGQEPMTYEAELFVILASRAQHVRHRIVPRLDKGEVVICDRYADATLAYQGGGRRLGLEEVARANALATGGLTPDRTVLCDLPIEEALARVGGREREGGETNRFDRERMDFHEAVRRTYLHLATQEPNRFLVVGTQDSREDVARSITQDILPLLDHRRSEGALI